MKHLMSYWERSVLLKTFDFAILGAGLIGKQIAIRIQSKYPKARIALVDRSPISYGASTRNAGFACFGSVSEIIDDFRRSPEKEVMALAEKRYKGIVELADTFGKDAIAYRPTGSYEVFTKKEDLQEAKDQMAHINRLLLEQMGLKEVFQLKSAQHLKMTCEPETIFNPYEGMLNSGLLNQVVSAKAHQLGVIPLYGLNIKEINQGDHAYTMHSENGIEVKANQLIIANNAFAGPFLPNEDIQAARGQIIITEPLDDLPFEGIFHSDKGYIYFRTIDGRILIGGGRNQFPEQEHTFDFEGTDNIKQYLENYLRQVVLPRRIFDIDMHWTGIMAMGKEKIPIVKRVNDNLLLCVRMGGMGVALGPVLSREIAGMV